MQIGAHLPLIDFGDEPRTPELLTSYAARAAELGFDMVSGNDHLVFPAPWIDGPMALAAVAAAAAPATLATTVYVPALRHPVVAAKALAALDRLAGGRLVVGVGPGSSPLDYAAVVSPSRTAGRCSTRPSRAIRALWRPDGPPFVGRHYSTEDVTLSPAPCRTAARRSGSAAGARPPACAGSPVSATAGSPPPTTSTRPSSRSPGPRCRTCWSSTIATRRPSPTRSPRGGSTSPTTRPPPTGCCASASLPSSTDPRTCCAPGAGSGRSPPWSTSSGAFRDAGAQRVLLWPVGDEVAQLERFHAEVWPQLTPRSKLPRDVAMRSMASTRSCRVAAGRRSSTNGQGGGHGADARGVAGGAGARVEPHDPVGPAAEAGHRGGQRLGRVGVPAVGGDHDDGAAGVVAVAGGEQGAQVGGDAGAAEAVVHRGAGQRRSPRPPRGGRGSA